MDTLDKILYMIKLKGLSDSDFVDRIGLYKTVLAEWKSGKTKSYLKHLPTIARVLGVSEEFLLDNTEIKIAESLELNNELQRILLDISSLNEENMAYLRRTIQLLHNQQNNDSLK